MMGLIRKFLHGKSAPDGNFGEILAEVRRLIRAGEVSTASAMLEDRVRVAPLDLDALALLGWTYFDLGRPEQARQALLRVLEANPNHVEALNTLGAVDSDAADPMLPIGWFRKAREVEPANESVRYNLAQKLFFASEYKEGFELLKARHRLHFGRDNPLDPLPVWKGESLREKTAFVWCDWGGLGDHLQFVRYVKLFRDAAQPARLLLGCQGSMLKLFAGIAGVDGTVAPGVVPDADVHVPLLDLPVHFATDKHTVPADMPYLRCPDDQIVKMARLVPALNERDGSLRVGVVWATGAWNQGAAYDRIRKAKSVPAYLLSKIALEHVTLFRLQKDLVEAEAAPNMVDASASVTDFADTAGVIAQLDVVVSADTAVAHLAGAMGKPVILMLRHESGMFWSLAAQTSPWYPSMEIVRQTRPGDWDYVLDSVASRLAGMRPAR